MVYIAPEVFAALDPKLDDGVTSLMEVLGGVFPGRVIAATHVAAGEAQAQIYPSTTSPQAYFAALCIWFQVSDLINVLAF